MESKLEHAMLQMTIDGYFSAQNKVWRYPYKDTQTSTSQLFQCVWPRAQDW